MDLRLATCIVVGQPGGAQGSTVAGSSDTRWKSTIIEKKVEVSGAGLASSSVGVRQCRHRRDYGSGAVRVLSAGAGDSPVQYVTAIIHRGQGRHTGLFADGLPFENEY